MNIFDNATLWVGISFILFLIIVLKPLLKLTNDTVSKKIKNIKEKINAAEALRSEAESILNELKKKNFREKVILIKSLINQEKKQKILKLR